MSERLTRREVQCLRLAGRDLGNKAIAQALGISPSTVENHLTSAYAKLGTSDRRVAAGLVARDYPEHPHFAPTPMAVPGGPGPGEAARGDEAPGASDPGHSRWILPAPPTRLLRMLGVILGFAALSGLVTGGLVLVARGSMETLAPSAPPNAVLALDSSQPSRTQ